MKIQCQSCQAKYTIADEKVLGKIVKIRCKKCSSTIVINGQEQAAALAQGGDGHAFDYAAAGADQWTVNVADGDQRTLTVAEIAAEYRNGVVNEDTYCWKDGMPDWLPLQEIEELYGAVVSGGASTSPPEEVLGASIPPPHSSPPAHFGGGEATDFSVPAAHASGNGAHFDEGATAIQQVPAPAAARRAGGRAQGADLFGNVEKAGGEDDVMTSAAAAASMPPPSFGSPSAEERLTGQRNENSVLFSLAALTQQQQPEDRTTATADGSGLIDIRALSANMDDNERKKDSGARVDDIMNLSGGGAFGAALAAPILAPAPLEAVDMGALGTAEAPGKQNKTLLIGILGGSAILGICAVAVAMLMRSPTEEVAKVDPAATTADTASMAAPPTTPDTTPTPPPAAEPDDSPPPPGTGQSTAAAAPAAQAKAPTAKAATPAAAKPAAPAAPAAPAKPAPAAKPKDLSGALAEAAGRKADPPAARATTSTASFDRGAAAAALGGVNVQSCKKAGGPTGPGRVTVTFAPSGAAQSAVVDPPYQGTPVGGCVAGKFRGARVPAFGGAPVRVGKSFSIN